MTGMAADYIIVGGGSAGAVLASRLSEDGKSSVILLEAGGTGRDFLVQMPAGLAKMMGNPRYDWKYPQAEDPTLEGRTFEWAAGKMLGGGSSINGQVHMRGTRDDFDNWERLGAKGWDYDSVLPYFRKYEAFAGPPSQDRGAHGPQSVEPMREAHPLSRTFLEACAEKGIPTLPDYGDGEMDGAFQTVATQRNGWRCSTEKAYLRPAAVRDNLQVRTGVHVDKILFEGRRAVGVQARIEGRPVEVRAQREVIVSAGAMGSPLLLLRSGIGPADELNAEGIGVVFDSPEVGKNLVEHLGIAVTKFVNVSTYNAETGPIHMVKHFFQLLVQKKGALANPVAHALALARSQPDLKEPDIQLHFLPLAYGIGDGATPAEMEAAPAVSTYVNICRPHSRGEIKLDSSDPSGGRIYHHFLGDERDLRTLVDACKLIENLYQADAWKGVVTGARLPNPVPDSDEGWATYIRQRSAPIYHPVGSCRMGSDDRAVVLPDTKVRGVDGLRVIDASIMPALISANTNAATIMIGERAADLVKS